MGVLGVLKRLVPFVAAFTLGVLIASIFVPITRPGYRFERGRKCRSENQRLREENDRLRQRIESLESEFRVAHKDEAQKLKEWKPGLIPPSTISKRAK